jgi:hypothetical protein
MMLQLKQQLPDYSFTGNSTSWYFEDEKWAILINEAKST